MKSSFDGFHKPNTPQRLESSLQKELKPGSPFKPLSPNPPRFMLQQQGRNSTGMPLNRMNQSGNGFIMGSKAESKDRTTTFNEVRSLSKTVDQVEVENSFLLQQLAERDDLIRSFKQSRIQNGEPHTDEIIGNTNLRLAQKNVILDRIYKRLMQMEEEATSQGIQLSPICVENMKYISRLIEEHEKHQTIVRSKFIETSHLAEKVYILNEKYAMDYSHQKKQITILREKLVNYENQLARLNGMNIDLQHRHSLENQRRNSLMNNLKAQLNGQIQTSNRERQEIYRKHEVQINNKMQQINTLTNQNHHFNVMVQQMKSELQSSRRRSPQKSEPQSPQKGERSKKGEIEERREADSMDWKKKYDQLYEQTIRHKEQINYLNFQILDMKKKGQTPSKPSKFILDENDEAEKLRRQIVSWKNKHSQIQELYSDLQIRYNNLSSTNRELLKWRAEYENAQFEISTLQMQNNSLSSKIKRLQEDESYETLEWKIKYEEATSSLRQTKKQLEEYRNNESVSFGKRSFSSESYKTQYEQQRRKAEQLEQELSKIRGEFFDLQRESELFLMREKSWLDEKAEMEKQQQYLQVQIRSLASEFEEKAREVIQAQENNDLKYQQIQQKVRQEFNIQFNEQISIRQEEMKIQITQSYEERIRIEQENSYKKQMLLRSEIEELRLELQQQEREYIEVARELTEEEIRQIHENIELEIKEKIVIEVDEKIRSTIEEQISTTIRLEYEGRINESQIQLNEAKEYIEKLVIETERLSTIIIGLEEKYQELLQKQDISSKTEDNDTNYEHIKMLQERIKEQEQAILKGRNFLEQAEDYIEQLMKELEEQKNSQQNVQQVKIIEKYEFQIKELNIAKDSYLLQLQTVAMSLKLLQNRNEQLEEKVRNLEQFISTLNYQKQQLKTSFQTEINQVYERMNDEKALWNQEKQIWTKEQYLWNEEREHWYEERNLWSEERKNWDEQRNFWQRQREAWEQNRQQMEQQKQKVVVELQQTHANLVNAEDYIQYSTKESQQIIANLEAQLFQLKNKHLASEEDEFRYYVDERYEKLIQKLLDIAEQQKQQSISQAEFYQLQMRKRQQKSESLRRKLNEGLEIAQNLEQVLILKRSEFKKLNISYLSQFIKYVDGLRETDIRINSQKSEEIINKLRQVYEG